MILWGILLGGVVYSHVVYFPVYLSHLPESAIITNGEYALHEEHFWMFIHPVLVLSLIVSLAANWSDAMRRKLIASTLVVYIAIIIISMIYFVPQLAEFHNSPRSGISSAEWIERGQRWQQLSWIRGAALFVFAFPLLVALARSSKNADS
ncbi:MAG: DUF1772 domain-containing protein [Chloracidobacterium sp.]|nr:DUF1772 domain-containing protein [Chloracidobacterium sp.]